MAPAGAASKVALALLVAAAAAAAEALSLPDAEADAVSEAVAEAVGEPVAEADAVGVSLGVGVPEGLRLGVRVPEGVREADAPKLSEAVTVCECEAERDAVAVALAVWLPVDDGDREEDREPLSVPEAERVTDPVRDCVMPLVSVCVGDRVSVGDPEPDQDSDGDRVAVTTDTVADGDTVAEALAEAVSAGVTETDPLSVTLGVVVPVAHGLGRAMAATGGGEGAGRDVVVRSCHLCSVRWGLLVAAPLRSFVHSLSFGTAHMTLTYWCLYVPMHGSE